MEQDTTTPVQPRQQEDGGLSVAPWPKVDFDQFGPVQRRKRTRIQKISASNLHRNWVRIPHVTNHDDADVTELDLLRQSLNSSPGPGDAKLTLLPFLIKAAAIALQRCPAFNASIDGDTLVLKEYVHVGFAVDTPFGLMVPVIRDADKKSVREIAAAANALAASARAGKLPLEAMTGGCFSISSLGGVGARYFTPIINAPEVAILGVGTTQRCLVPEDGGSAVRQLLPLSLSWDHRAVDGVGASLFLQQLKRALGEGLHESSF